MYAPNFFVSQPLQNDSLNSGITKVKLVTVGNVKMHGQVQRKLSTCSREPPSSCKELEKCLPSRVCSAGALAKGCSCSREVICAASAVRAATAVLAAAVATTCVLGDVAVRGRARR